MTRIENEWRYFDKALGMNAPWYTLQCLEWLDHLDLKGKRVFEFGVGDSTFWYREKGAITNGVDNDWEWVNKTCAWHGEGEEDWYLNSIDYISREDESLFDIVVIDGDYRDKCTAPALKFLKPGGFLIIDNYKQKTADLEHWPLTEKLIEGMDVKYFKEHGHEDWQTIVVKK